MRRNSQLQVDGGRGGREGGREDVQFFAGAGECFPGHGENGEDHQVPKEADDEEEEDEGEGQFEDGGAGGHESSSF